MSLSGEDTDEPTRNPFGGASDRNDYSGDLLWAQGAVMRKLIRAVLAWSERKFPDRVMVTETSYLALQARIGALESDLVAVGERVKKAEALVLMHSQAMGFTQRPDMSLER